jgi:hypothetical protein
MPLPRHDRNFPGLQNSRRKPIYRPAIDQQMRKDGHKWGETSFSHFVPVHSEDPMKIVSTANLSDGDRKSAHNYAKNM